MNEPFPLRKMEKKMKIAILLCCIATSALACDHSKTQYNRFRAIHPCPATGLVKGACPGYVVDHVIALCKDGPDHPINMQWQTRADAKAKDKWECR